MRLTAKDIEHLADLAHLALGDAEKAKYEEQLSSVLGYVAKLGEIGEAAASLTGSDAVNVFREDIVDACEPATRERIVRNFPAKEGDLLAVPAVFGETKEDF